MHSFGQIKIIPLLCQYIMIRNKASCVLMKCSISCAAIKPWAMNTDLLPRETPSGRLWSFLVMHFNHTLNAIKLPSVCVISVSIVVTQPLAVRNTTHDWCSVDRTSCAKLCALDGLTAIDLQLAVRSVNP